MKTVEVVAAIIHQHGKILATQRGYGEHQGMWEFPGGKMETGETEEDAIVREIREELNVEIRVEKKVCTVEYDYPKFHLVMHCFWCSIVKGELELKEHQSACWLEKTEWESVDWLPADVEVVKCLKGLLSNYSDINCNSINRGMKMKLNFWAVIIAALTLVCAACTPKDTDNKQLVLYYSQTGSTKAVAEEIRKMLDTDIEVIELVNPYTGTYDETLERVKQERKSGQLPVLKPLKADLSKYEVIYLGYPIWFGTYALPIASLLKEYNFEGKKIVPFCTFGSGDMESAMMDLKKALPKAEIAEHGFGIRDVRVTATPKELNRFLIEYGYMKGQVDALPGYSEMRPVAEEEKLIFDAACKDYKYPLGTPILVGKRGTPDGVDYIYEVENNGATNTIYVTVANEADAKPEFTRVVR